MKKAVSNAQRQANARNAQRSTGPKTPAGKAALARLDRRRSAPSSDQNPLAAIKTADSDRPS